MVVIYKLWYNAKMQQNTQLQFGHFEANLLVCYNVKTSKQVLASLDCIINVDFPYKKKQTKQKAKQNIKL